jgi:carbon storage regulator
LEEIRAALPGPAILDHQTGYSENETKTGEGHRGVNLGRTSNGGEMLVLTRKTNQSIMIGDDIEVSVLAVSRDKIRLGITAPRDVPVFRKEVYLSIKDESGGGADTSIEEALEGTSKKK